MNLFWYFPVFKARNRMERRGVFFLIKKINRKGEERGSSDDPCFVCFIDLPFSIS